MTYAEYEAIDAVRWSHLKNLRRSPLHYRHALTAEDKQTPAKALGDAVHVSIFEPRLLPLKVAVGPEDVNRRTKAGREEWQAFLDANAGKTIVTAEQYEIALSIGDAVRAHPIAGPMLERGKAEQAIVWTDPETRLRCKGRVDWREAPAVFLDLKTARTIDLHRFAGQAWALGYMHQLCMYRRGIAIEARCSVEAVTARIIAVENTAPFDVAVYEPDADSLEVADREVGALLVKLSECRARDEWPGAHMEAVETLRAPVYALDDDYEWEVSSQEVA